MKRTIWIFQSCPIILLVALSMALFACANKSNQLPPTAPTSTVNSHDVQVVDTPFEPFTDIGDSGFLSKQPCGPPCFMGITPGISKEAEVLEFLQRKIDLSYCDSWDTTNTGGTKGIRCDKVGFTFRDTDIVNGIGFKPDKQISVNEVLAVYGNPDSLL